MSSFLSDTIDRALYGLTVSLAVGGASRPSPRPSTKPHQPPREHALTQPRQRVTRLRHLYPVNHCAWGNPQSHAWIDFSESICVPRSVFEFLGRECLRSVPSMTWVSLSEVLSVSRTSPSSLGTVFLVWACADQSHSRLDRRPSLWSLRGDRRCSRIPFCIILCASQSRYRVHNLLRAIAEPLYFVSDVGTCLSSRRCQRHSRFRLVSALAVLDSGSDSASESPIDC